MRKLILLLPLIFLSCNKKEIVAITIENNRSNKIELFTGKYTVHFMDKDDIEYNFNINENEIAKIKEVYDKENIVSYENELLIIDDKKPLIMPFTELKYSIDFSNGSKQVFTIRTDFTNNPLYLEKYKKLKIFTETINNIVKSKNEIKNAENSNFLYL